jgi:hypothetical protein
MPNVSFGKPVINTQNTISNGSAIPVDIYPYGIDAIVDTANGDPVTINIEPCSKGLQCPNTGLYYSWRWILPSNGHPLPYNIPSGVRIGGIGGGPYHNKGVVWDLPYNVANIGKPIDPTLSSRIEFADARMFNGADGKLSRLVFYAPVNEVETVPSDCRYTLEVFIQRKPLDTVRYIYRSYGTFLFESLYPFGTENCYVRLIDDFTLNVSGVIKVHDHSPSSIEIYKERNDGSILFVTAIADTDIPGYFNQFATMSEPYLQDEKFFFLYISPDSGDAIKWQYLGQFYDVRLENIS